MKAYLLLHMGRCSLLGLISGENESGLFLVFLEFSFPYVVVDIGASVLRAGGYWFQILFSILLTLSMSLNKIQTHELPTPSSDGVASSNRSPISSLSVTVA